jgi:hypothetical protein
VAEVLVAEVLVAEVLVAEVLVDDVLVDDVLVDDVLVEAFPELLGPLSTITLDGAPCEFTGLAEFFMCELPELEDTGEFPVLTTTAGLFPSGLLWRFVEGFVSTTEAATGAANAGPLVSADILSM